MRLDVGFVGGAIGSLGLKPVVRATSGSVLTGFLD